MKSSREEKEGPLDFISNFFDEVIGVISGFFKWVTDMFSGSFGEDSKKSDTEIKRQVAKTTDENSPQNLLAKFELVVYPKNNKTNLSELEKLEQSFKNGETSFVENSGNPQKYFLNLAPCLDKSLLCKQSSGELSKIQQSESILNESSTSEELSQEEVAKIFYEIFTKHNREYNNIDDFIDKFADGFIRREYGEWLPDKIKEVEKEAMKTSADPTSSPLVRPSDLSADKTPSEGKKVVTPRL